ncbi:hypothetical protein BpHYR1_048761 [Brachionus plicatilis]|uniref:Chromo domain-containing protein n=1 Tax=Brachionus plicatilis TaxID=10195 RepID=A0A3M7RYV5_BRAPC|nr:hypothetical protein BpHYR1_048761 [Brachionus plicatilis]
MFGRKMNGFNDWSSIDPDFKHNAVERVKQIKDLIDDKYPTALQNIDKAKSSQIKAQNNNRPVTETDVFKQRLSDTFPLQRLKLDKSPSTNGGKDEAIFEFEKIINHRLNKNKKYEFLVIWKSYSLKHNSSEPMDSFLGKKPIEDYWSKLNKPKKVGRPRKTNANHVTFPNMLNILITILFFLIKPLSTVRINGRFTVCETPDQTNIENTLILNTEKDCYASHATQKIFVESDKKIKRVDLLFKQILTIDGNGYECSKQKIIIDAYVNLFGSRSSPKSIHKVEIGKKECENMLSSRTCEGSKMSCENDDCIFDGTPKEIFKWLRPVMSYGFVCTSSFVYWIKEIVNFCPYRLYMTIGLNLPFNNVFSNTNGDQIFKINQTFNECGMKLYGCTEGLFFTYNRKNLPKIKADFVTIHDLILAGSDGIELKTYTALDRLKEEI